MDKGIVYGLFAAAGLAVYFLLMRMLGLHDEYWLRVFNIVIVGTGLYMLLNNHIRRDHSRIGYLGSLGLGIRYTLTAVGVFILFLALYVNVIDKGFMEELQDATIWGTTITPGLAVMGLLIEGVVSGMILTFVMMQFFKGYLSRQDDE